MSLDKYQQAWKADAARMQLTIDADLLSKEVQRSHRSFQSTIFWRDVREAGASLLMIPLWFAMGIPLSLPWTWYLTVPALVWVAGFILVDRRRHPQRPSEPGEPLLFYAKEALTQVEHQIWLLRNVFWWYLLPFSISIMAFFLHISWRSSSTWWVFVLSGGCWGASLLVVYGATYRLNQRAVRTQLEPRRQDLLKLVASLEQEPTSEDSPDVIDLVSALADPVSNAGLNSSWADNWNYLVPSWRAAAAIILPTLIGALCGLYSGLWLRIPEMGPVFFQTVVAAVIPFEIALVCVWFWQHKKRKQPISVDEQIKRLPGAPAIAIIVLTLFIGILAVLAVISFLVFAGAFTSFSAADEPREPDFGDVSPLGDSEIESIDTWLQKQVDLAKYPSLTVAIVRDGKIAYGRAFGFEDIKTSEKATLQTQYNVASVTKVFTSSLAVLLHEQGVVDLDQPVVKYLPDDVSISTTPELGATITLRQLASHTSGLPRGVPGRVQSVEGWYELEPQRLYDHLAGVQLTSDPGTEELYSNLGFGLLGHALELAADKPLDRLVHEMLCVPLKLERTAIQADDTPHPATGYDASRWHFEKTQSFRERLAASGGLVASVEDLAKFLAAQMEPGVFTSEMLAQLHARSSLSNGILVGTALGWSSEFSTFLGRFPEKNGGRSNCSAWIGFAPEGGVGVVVVTNCGGPNVDPIGRWLLERSVPGAYKPVAKFGYAKVTPFTGVRWENERPIVRVQDRWSPLVSINEIPIDRIMEFANKEYGEIAHKRFAEDLVEVFSKMGHELDWEVTLRLETPGEQDEQLQIRMTEQNRGLAREYLREHD